jgi:hypothetical protein
MSDDHSKVVPLLPIPNRTVKRFCADDSAGSRVKVGHRQSLTASISPTQVTPSGAFVFADHDRASAMSSACFILCRQAASFDPVPLDGSAFVVDIQIQVRLQG